MTKKPWPHRDDRPTRADAALDFSMDELLSAPTPAPPHAPTITTMQADCCVAKAAYLVVLPATTLRPQATELLLCGHHFRAGKDGLRRAHATAFDGQTNKMCAIAD